MINFLKRLFIKDTLPKDSWKNIVGEDYPVFDEERFEMLYNLFDDDYFNEQAKAKKALIEAIENPNENPNKISAETKKQFFELMKDTNNHIPNNNTGV